MEVEAWTLCPSTTLFLFLLGYGMDKDSAEGDWGAL